MGLDSSLARTSAGINAPVTCNEKGGKERIGPHTTEYILSQKIFKTVYVYTFTYTWIPKREVHLDFVEQRKVTLGCDS